MKLRHLKQILKQYPPILVVQFPPHASMAEMEEFRYSLRTSGIWKHPIAIIPHVEPIVVGKIPSKEAIERFKMEWAAVSVQSTFQIIDSSAELVGLSQKNIEIISPFKIPISVYKRKLEKLNELLNNHKR